MEPYMGVEPTDKKLQRGTVRRRSRRLSYRVREIDLDDLNHGFLEELSNLSETRGLDPEAARRLLLKIRTNPFHKVFVAVKEDGEVIGTSTLIIEQKFIHNFGLVGHVEDVSVRKAYEGTGVGSSLVKKAVERAKKLGCYKCILDCDTRLTKFYEKLGFRKHEIGMRRDLLSPAAAHRKLIA
jgi:glucosamine-phosphate N-acetyltransferase